MTKVITGKDTEMGVVQDDVLVREGGDLTLIGMVTGTLTVGGGGHARIFGTVGRLVVQDAGAARLDGTCFGDARNESGELAISAQARVDGATYGHTTTV